VKSRTKLKMLSIVTAAGALAIMGAVTLIEGASDTAGAGSPQIVADTPTGSSAATTPSIPSAVPAVKATKFAGGDWSGM
jgi:hypothetical protein